MSLALIYTRVIARFIRTAHAFVASDRWVGTNGPGATRLICGGDDFSGRTSFLYPALQCCLDAVLAIGARTWNRADHSRASPASAMLHSRHHVQPHELTRGSIAHFCRDVLVVIDGAERGDIGIAPAVIEDQLAARIFERFEICVRGIAYWPELIVQKRDVVVEAETAEIPRGILINDLG